MCDSRPSVCGHDGDGDGDRRRDDFRILEDGRPTDVTVFSNEVQPITVAALLDTSDSMGGKIARVKAAAGPFSDALLPADRVRFGTFGREIPFADIVDELHAVDASITALESAPPPRLVVLVTDGRATGNRLGLDEVARHAVAAGVSVHIVLGLDQDGDPAIRPSSEARRLADSTGGLFESYTFVRSSPGREIEGPAARMRKDRHDDHRRRRWLRAAGAVKAGRRSADGHTLGTIGAASEEREPATRAE